MKPKAFRHNSAREFSAKKSLTVNRSPSAYEQALSCLVHKYYKSSFRSASRRSSDAGAFACRFFREFPRTVPPTAFVSVHPSTCESKRRYIMQKINLRDLYPDAYKTDVFVDVLRKS